MDKTTPQDQMFLLEINQVISNARNLSEGLQNLTHKIIKHMQTTYCCFLLIDEETNQLILEASQYADRRLPIHWNGPTSSQPCAQQISRSLQTIIDNGSPVVLKKGQSDFDILACLHCTAGIPDQLENVLLTPINSHDRSLGLCILGELYSQFTQPFSENDVLIAGMMANQVAGSIEKIRLLENYQRQNKLLTSLDDVSLNLRVIDDGPTMAHKIIENAVKLIDRKVGVYLTYIPSLSEIKISAHKDGPEKNLNEQFVMPEWLTRVVKSGIGSVYTIHSPSCSFEEILSNHRLGCGLAVPIIGDMEVEAILLIGQEPFTGFSAEEIKILKRFAVHAYPTLLNSSLINNEQRSILQFSVLQRIHNYIQSTDQSTKMQHAILTGITAKYGLGFNRAALFLFDEEVQTLKFELAIGHNTQEEAFRDWEAVVDNKIEDFDYYLEQINLDLIPPGPLDQILQGCLIPTGGKNNNLFTEVLKEKKIKRIPEELLFQLPQQFQERFNANSACVIVPLISRQKPIGLIVVDNKFSRSPISQSTENALNVFANTVASVYDKISYIEEIREDKEKQKILFEISKQLSIAKDITEILKTLLAGGNQLLGVDMAVAHLRNETNGELQSYYVPVEFEALFTKPRGEKGLTGLVMDEFDSEYLFIPDTTQHKRVNPELITLGIKSLVGFPLQTQGKITGALFFNSREKRMFSKKDLEFVRSMISMGAVAIHNDRKSNESKKNTRLQNALVQVNQDLVTGNAEVDQLHIILDFVQEQFNAPIFYIGFYDDFENMVTYPLAVEMGNEIQIPSETYLGKSPFSAAEYVLHSGKPLIWFSESEKENLVREHSLKIITNGSQTKTSFLLPLYWDGKTQGFIAIQDTQDHAWDEADKAAFITLSHQVSNFFRNKQLIEGINEGKELLQATFSATQQVTTNQDPDETLKVISERVCQVMKAKRAKVVIMDQSGNILRQKSYGYNQDDEINTAVRSNGISQQVLISKTPRYNPDLRREASEYNQFIFNQGIRATACLPLIYLGICRGVLWVDFDHPRRFLETDKTTLQLFADQAAIAYFNAHQIRELDHIQNAAEALSSTLSLTETLNQIAESAREVMQVHSASIWSYDQQRKKFNLEESVAAGIPQEIWIKHRKEDLLSGHTAQTILNSESGWVGVEDISDKSQYNFVGESTRKMLEAINVKSFQGIRLQTDNEIFGILYLNNESKRCFSELDQKTARVLANHAALALKNARMVNQISKSKEFAALVTKLTVLGQFKDSLDLIVRGTKDLLNADSVSLHIYNQETQCFEFPPLMLGVKDREEALKTGRVEKNSVPYRIINHGKMHITTDSRKDEIMGGQFTVREGIQCSMGCPLIVRDLEGKRDEIVGVMCVNFNDEIEFQDFQKEQINSFADQAAITIYNWKLYKTLQQRIGALNALNNAGKTIIQSLELDEILAPIAKAARDLTGRKGELATTASIILKDKENPNIALFYAGDPPEEFEKIASRFSGGINLDVGFNHRGMIGTAIVSGESQLCGEVSKRKDYLELSPQTCSELAVPIRVGDEVFGAINVEHTQPNVFDADDVRDLETLAAYVGIAIKHAKQFAFLKELGGYVGNKTAIEWVQLVSEGWSHEIKTDIATARGHITKIKKDKDVAQNDKVSAYLSNLDDFLVEVNDKRLRPPQIKEDVVSDIKINKLIKSYLDHDYKPTANKMIPICYGLEEDLDQQAVFYGRRMWLIRAFEILVQNAVQAMVSANSPQKQLSVGTQLEGNEILISFADTGPGIPQDLVDKIFNERIESAKGSGVGLMLARTYVEFNKGSLMLKQTDKNGTEFLIRLPAIHKG